jgi:hypothetical protein
MTVAIRKPAQGLDTTCTEKIRRPPFLMEKAAFQKHMEGVD